MSDPDALPRWLTALTEDDVLDDEEISPGYLLSAFYETDIYPDPDANAEQWLEEAIAFNPEIWKAKLCRIKHDIPETNQGIAFCGLCKEYANPRKRARDAATGPVLPGFEAMGGAFQIHQACSSRALAWIRRTLYRWEKIGKVTREVLQQIPDVRQSRGWDFATRVKITNPVEQVYPAGTYKHPARVNDPAARYQYEWQCPRCSHWVFSSRDEEVNREQIAQDALCFSCRWALQLFEEVRVKATGEMGQLLSAWRSNGELHYLVRVSGQRRMLRREEFETRQEEINR